MVLAKQPFEHVMAKQLTVEYGAAVNGGLTVDGVAVVPGVMRVPGAGEDFYVTDAANGGDDSNDGKRNSPFLTIANAQDHAVSGRNDYIIVFRHDDATETWPIELTKSYLHLIGTVGQQATPTPSICPPGNTHGIVLAAGGIEIAGFNLRSVAANQKACIYGAAAQQWMNHIHHNFFAWDSEAYDCILLENQQCQMSIHHNYFGVHGYDNYGILGTGGGGVSRICIEDNVFFVKGRVQATGVGGIVIHSDFGGTILNNVFRIPDSVDGEAITLTGQNMLVDGNHAMAGVGATTTQNPYKEDGDNHWGLNHNNGTMGQPA